MIKREDVFRIGRLGKPHGVKGDIMFNFTDDVFDRVESEYLFIEIDGLLVPFFIEEYSFCNNDIAVMKFEKLNTSEAVRQYTGCDVFFPVELSDGKSSCHLMEMIRGYELKDLHGNRIGTIADVDDSTSNVLFYVNSDEGREILIPASDDLICDIDQQNSTITMNIPDGVLEL